MQRRGWSRRCVLNFSMVASSRCGDHRVVPAKRVTFYPYSYYSQTSSPSAYIRSSTEFVMSRAKSVSIDEAVVKSFAASLVRQLSSFVTCCVLRMFARFPCHRESYEHTTGAFAVLSGAQDTRMHQLKWDESSWHYVGDVTTGATLTIQVLSSVHIVSRSMLRWVFRSCCALWRRFARVAAVES